MILLYSYLGVIGLLIYAIIAFSSFDSMFDRGGGVYGYTFILAVTSTIKLGLRNGGGLGDALTQFPVLIKFLSISGQIHSLLFSTYFLSKQFLVLFWILLVNYEMKASFSERNTRKMFICSLEKNDLDTKGKYGWRYHIFLETQCLSYAIFYKFYTKQIPIDCNSLEKFVKNVQNLKILDSFHLKKHYKLTKIQLKRKIILDYYNIIYFLNQKLLIQYLKTGTIIKIKVCKSDLLGIDTQEINFIKYFQNPKYFDLILRKKNQMEKTKNNKQEQKQNNQIFILMIQ